MLREIFCQAYPEILTFRIPKAQAMMGFNETGLWCLYLISS